VAGHWGKRCGARTRSGGSCGCKALENGRCRLHGGLSTGPKTERGIRATTENLQAARRALGLASPEERSHWAKRAADSRRKNQYRATLIVRGLILSRE